MKIKDLLKGCIHVENDDTVSSCPFRFTQHQVFLCPAKKAFQEGEAYRFVCSLSELPVNKIQPLSERWSQW